MKKLFRLVVVALAGAVALGAARPGWAEWDPVRFAAEDTLELLTVSATEGEHWFPVWLVVVDGQLFVRLGTRAANRVEGNTRAPILSVRVAGEEFAAVHGEPAPDMAERVAQAMAEKYTTDILIRHFAHPLTLRLIPQSPPG
jgi:hypothetical protein